MGGLGGKVHPPQRDRRDSPQARALNSKAEPSRPRSRPHDSTLTFTLPNRLTGGQPARSVATMPAKTAKKMRAPVLMQLVDGKECVTVPEAARLRGVSRQAIWMRIQRKTLPSIAVAGRIFIPLDALQ